MKLTETEFQAVETMSKILTEKLNSDRTTVIERSFLSDLREKLEVLRFVPVEL